MINWADLAWACTPADFTRSSWDYIQPRDEDEHGCEFCDQHDEYNRYVISLEAKEDSWQELFPTDDDYRNRGSLAMRLTANRTVYDRLSRRLLSCSYCRPHRNENAASYGTYGPRKPRRKEHR